MRVGEAEGDPEGDGGRTLVNGWESRLWRLEDKHLREGTSVRQFGRPRPLRICHRRKGTPFVSVIVSLSTYALLLCLSVCLSLSLSLSLSVTLSVSLSLSLHYVLLEH